MRTVCDTVRVPADAGQRHLQALEPVKHKQYFYFK